MLYRLIVDRFTCGVTAIALSACASGGEVVDTAQPVPASIAGEGTIAGDAHSLDTPPVDPQTINKLIDTASAEVDKPAPPPPTPPARDEINAGVAEQMPRVLNHEVERWLDFFTNKDRERFQRFLERGEKYKPQITAVLHDQGVPPEIFYQAMIESGFATMATSRAHAVGVWQFMRETGRRYGLRIDGYVDERRDPLRSTIAASLYLKDLYNVFQSWYLAVAAYNAGEGRIMNTIMRAKTRDFWEMAKLKVLPNETMNYIPKFLAATLIGQNPQQYGFTDLSPESMPELVAVVVPSPVRLTDVATLSGISAATLREFNPHLLRGITPPGLSTYRLWVPAADADAVTGISQKLAALRIRGLKMIASADSGVAPRSLPTKRYRVRAGDSLTSIARHFGVTIGDLKRLNRLRRNAVATGQILKIREQKG